MNSEYQQCFKGSFTSALHWSQLDELWQTLKQQSEGWHIYFVGKNLPEDTVDSEYLHHFLDEMDVLLRKEHPENYCGIVYSDSFKTPSLIKIFDPNNLGASCGSLGAVVSPRWILSRLPPEAIVDEAPIPMNRQRWWKSLFA